ncbi:glycerophosphoryl diester phosphodiesterase membrane domain-containing protein [Spelaeicoccus albus]|uniref:Glycerophosphoryl diester phosphodiesterase membrane domain-containing protein n=1 Tax=Spelaeicoccus albus TaxID=1280376 RepID=A0A7Z0D351_9MICO|nr:glycerophosphoryl diester phosphodiesterase membrane domain-containing protein [Spelaeicoccus albus]NYI67958.1 hypothetical protein [Spelaeicoccus albus]
MTTPPTGWQPPDEPRWGRRAAPDEPGGPPGNAWGQWTSPSTWGQPTPGSPGGPGAYSSGYRPPPKPGLIPLHPLRLGEILDGGFQALRHNPKLMIGVPAVVMGVVLLATGGLTALAIAWADTVPAAAASSSDFNLGFSALSSVGNAAISLVEACVAQLVYGTLVLAVSRAVFGEKKSFPQIWPILRPRAWPLIGMSLLLIAITIVIFAVLLTPTFVLLANGSPIGALVTGIIGYLVGLLAALYVGIRFAVSACALVLERIGPVAALKRSWRLTGRGFWRFTGIYLLANVIGALVTSLISTPIIIVGAVIGTVAALSLQDHPAALVATGIVGGVLALIVLAIASAIQYAYSGGVTALLYIDQRMRTEGLDVTLMAEAERLAGRAGP